MRLVEGSVFGDWQRRNRDATLPHCAERVVTSGALTNLEHVGAGARHAGPYPHSGMVFSDSDVYKTLEAVAWDSSRDNSLVDDEFVTRALSGIEAAQRSDGYLNSFFQGQHPDLIWKDLRWGHELYCAGHLFQAAVAAERTGTLAALVPVSTWLLDHLTSTFSLVDGDGGLRSVCGHPEVETALVEYYRTTGSEKALQLAVRQIGLRGRADVDLPTTGVIDGRPFGLSYFLHHLPVRQRRSATGHAVRELYLQCGVVDVATETGSQHLLDASEAIWEDLYTAKTYLTGAHGSRHRDEAIGDPYELPSDRAYAETCAAIASFHWNWRLLLATGNSRYADAMDRALWNTIAGAVSIDGASFFYSNSLHVRTAHESNDEDAPRHRLDWYECACCPPNLARLMASVHCYLLTRDDRGLQLHFPFTGRVSTQVPGGQVELDVQSDYPWKAATDLRVHECTAQGSWTVAIRVPEWTERSSLQILVNDTLAAGDFKDGYFAITRQWRAGDTLRIRSSMPVRVLTANRRVDAVRDCVAVQRGPLVYCLEDDDLDGGAIIEDVAVDPSSDFEASSAVPSALKGTVRLVVKATGVRTDSSREPLYSATPRAGASEPIGLSFVPYFARANRPWAAMRVWVPRARRPSAQGPSDDLEVG